MESPLVPIETAVQMWTALMVLFGAYVVTAGVSTLVDLVTGTNSQLRQLPMRVLGVVVCLLKGLFYGMLLLTTLSFDPQTNSLQAHLPRAITFSQVILIPLSALELVSNLAEIRHYFRPSETA